MTVFTKPDFNDVWAENGEMIDLSSASIKSGWTKTKPSFQKANAIENRQDAFCAHVNQHGIPVWDSGTQYIAGKSVVQDSDGMLYQCITTNTGQNPKTDTSFSYWKKLLGRTVGGINGYKYNADGTIEQWGVGTFSGASDTVAIVPYNITFPNACWNIQVSIGAILGNGNFGAELNNASTFRLGFHDNNGDTAVGVAYYWRAIGN